MSFLTPLPTCNVADMTEDVSATYRRHDTPCLKMKAWEDTTQYDIPSKEANIVDAMGTPVILQWAGEHFIFWKESLGLTPYSH